MNLYIAGCDREILRYVLDNTDLKPKVLESFYSIKKNDEMTKMIPQFKSFMLDSGAFSFMQGRGSNVNFEAYLESYIDFVKTNKIKLFFELDIDSVVGYERVKEYRKRLERGVGRQCIPVWHTNRGKDDFVRMCEEYKYVALGGLVNAQYQQKYWKYFPYFIKTAHEHNAVIHALGFTHLEGITKYHFDSVDSTTWNVGCKFGEVCKFTGRTVVRYKKPKNSRAKTREIALNNFVEWVKFSNWAETHL